MRLQDILNMVADYLRLGIVLLVIAVVVLLIGYCGIYKKLCKGKREVDLKKVFWWIVFVFYLFVVLVVTLFRPSGVWNKGQIISFFYSYKEAWITASETAWRNIILNILMFVPLGFWLPVGMKRFRVFWKTYLVGFFMTVGIESFQLMFALGLFEVADVFNNTLGTMIGYGLYKAVEYIVQLFKKESPKLSRMVVCQIPLILAVAMFTTIFVAYEKQELGNLSIECISPYSEDTFKIVSNEEYSEENQTAMVYQTNILTVEETETFARNFFENLGTGLDESRNDIYEETAFYWAEDDYSIWIDYRGGIYNFTDFSISFPEDGVKEPQKIVDATEETIVEALLSYGIEIPEGAAFSYDSDMGYIFTVERVEVNGIIYDGQLTCDYYDNGKLSGIRNNIKQFEVYKAFEVCSEREAYEQILGGEFICAANPGDEIEIGKVSLEYVMDTKGFYQPVYNFVVHINEKESFIQIPAIEK